MDGSPAIVYRFDGRPCRWGEDRAIRGHEFFREPDHFEVVRRIAYRFGHWYSAGEEFGHRNGTAGE